MKKKYIKAEIEIIEFDTEDVIITSTGEDDGQVVNEGSFPE